MYVREGWKEGRRDGEGWRRQAVEGGERSLK